VSTGTVDVGTRNEYVQALARGIEVIRVFDGEYPAMTLSDVARRAGLTRAAARRFLHTFVSLGYVRTDGRLFFLTPRVLELGFSFLSSLALPEIVRPHLEQLSREVGESVSAALLDGSDIVYIARVHTRRIMSVRITIGTRFPAYVTSLGRVLLAALPRPERDALLVATEPRRQFTARTTTESSALEAELDRVAEQGWALVDGELELGLRSAAVPVRDKSGAVVAAINISTSAVRDTVEKIVEEYLPALLGTRDRIEAELRLR